MRDFDSCRLTLADNLRALRESANLTQTLLSESSGVARSQISAIERGLGNPSLSSLCSIANALGHDVCDLLEQSKISIEE